MYGAILGDIMSFRHNLDNDNIYFLVDRKIKFTGYTVTAIALADALTSVNIESDVQLKEKITQSFLKWSKKYVNKDFFDLRFEKWLTHEKHLPTQYYDSGAAARASIIPYLYNDLEQVKKIAKLTAGIICDNPPSILDAQFAAIAVFYAMRSSSKANLKTSFEYSIGSEISEKTMLKSIVVEAVFDFLKSSDIESAIENSISRGGNINVRAIISGSMAEAFYGVPFSSKEMCNRELPENILEVLDRFDKVSKRNFLKINDEGVSATEECIENALRRFNNNKTQENFSLLMEEFYYSIHDNCNLRVPLIVPNRNEIYEKGRLPEDTSYLILQSKDGKKFVAAFTGEDEEFHEKYPDVYLSTVKDIFSEIADEETEEDGIILNHNDKNLMFLLEKDLLRKILELEPPKNEMLFYDGHISELPIEAVVTSNFDGFKNISLENTDEIFYAHFMKKFPEQDDRYIIYSPLAFYKGKNKNVIFDCCQACLNLARKYHIKAVAFPFYFVSIGGRSVINSAIYSWFKKNERYGITIIVATGKEDDKSNSKERTFSKVNFTDYRQDSKQDEFADAPSLPKNIPVDEKSSSKFDYSKGKAISTSEEAKRKAREFKNQFADVEDFYKVLKDFGFKWKAENSNSEKIKTMWALNALACAIDEYQFDPFSK